MATAAIVASDHISQARNLKAAQLYLGDGQARATSFIITITRVVSHKVGSVANKVVSVASENVRFL